VSEFYDSLTQAADDLLTEFGQAGFLRRAGTATGPAYNPTPGTPSNYAATFAVTSFSRRDVDGTRIMADDKRVVMGKGSLTVEPKPGDVLVEADGGLFTVVRAWPIKPAGEAVMFVIQARR
jgi:hypothetical protein